MPVRELLARTDSRELTEWSEYFKLNPPDEGDWIRAAMLCATMVNMWRDRKRSKAAKIEDWLPWKDKRAKSKEKAEIMRMVLALGGEVKGK